MIFNHLEDLLNKIADTYGEHLYNEIMQSNSLKLLSRYAEMLGVELEHLEELIDDVRQNGW